MKDIEDKIPDITNLAINAILNAKINEVKNKIPSIANLAATAHYTSQDSADLVRFTEEIHNGKLNFLYSSCS